MVCGGGGVEGGWRVGGGEWRRGGGWGGEWRGGGGWGEEGGVFCDEKNKGLCFMIDIRDFEALAKIFVEQTTVASSMAS